MGASTASVWETIAVEAGQESELWAAALRPEAEREEQAVFSALAEARFAVGLETIYEGYLLHYGRPRLFRADDRDTRILLGDYLYAHGLVRIAALGCRETERRGRRRSWRSTARLPARPGPAIAPLPCMPNGSSRIVPA